MIDLDDSFDPADYSLASSGFIAYQPHAALPHMANILDRIDDTLDAYEDAYDVQGREFAPHGEPWPYEGF